MERIIVPKGTKQNFEDVFSDLQDNTYTNMKRRFDRFVGSYGVEATVKNGTVTSNEFKVQQASSTTLTIEAGSGITESFNFLRTTSQTTVNLASVSSGYYSVIASASPYTDTPVPIVNGFLYSAANSTADTRQHAATAFAVTASGTDATTSGLYLANIDWNGTDTITVYDRRDENVFLIKDSYVDDSNIVKKDRDSTISADLNQVGELTVQMSDSADSFTLKNDSGTTVASLLKAKNYFTQNTGLGGETSPSHPLEVTGVAAADEVRADLFTSHDNNDVLVQPKTAGGKIITKLFDATGTGEFQDKDGTVICYYDKDGFYFNKPVTYGDLVTVTTLNVTDSVTLPGYPTMSGVTNTEFLIGYGTLNGGAGLRVLTEDPDPTDPINFRIYDNKPTSNLSERQSYVHFKWNYDDINGSYVSSNIFEVTALLEQGGNLDEASADIVDKYLYFPETGNRYQILTWNNTTKQMTLGDNYDDEQEEPNIPNYPCRIIDGAGTGYQLKITSNKDNSAELDFKESDTLIRELDSSFITNPEVSVKLSLNETHWIQLRTVNSNTLGSYVLLPSGQYDPDHAPGGQAVQDYAQPFENDLPNLTDDGAITATPTLNGFAVDITGWEDETDPDKTAHEFQVAYTTLDSLDWSDQTRTTRIKTEDRHVPISVAEADTYQIGVRGFQNKQLVTLAKTTSVVSGGGGIPPNAVKIAGADFNVQRIAGAYTTKTGGTYGGSSEDDWYLSGITWSGVAPAPGRLDGKYIDFETGGYDNIRIYSNTGVPTDSYIWLNPGTVTGDIPAGPENFTIAQTKTGRRVMQTNLPADFKVTFVHVTVESGRWLSATSPAVLRVWQDGQETSAGTVDITTRNGIVTGVMDVDIKTAYGASRTLVVDLWDPDTSSPNNYNSVAGHVDIYGEITLQRNNQNTGGVVDPRSGGLLAN